MKKFLLILLFILSIGIPLAEGHPFTVETNPPQGSNAPVGITQISVQFSEAIEIEFSALKVFESNGHQIDNKDTAYYQQKISETLLYPEAGARFPGLVGQTIVLGCVISSLLIWKTNKKDLISEKLTQLQEKFHSKFVVSA